jgi:hypothetical protein
MEQEWTGINPSTAVPKRTTAKFAIDFEAHIRKVAGSFFIYCFFIRTAAPPSALSARCRRPLAPDLTLAYGRDGDGDVGGAARRPCSARLCNCARSPAAKKRSPAVAQLFDQPCLN